LFRAPALHQCPHCAFEDNSKAKLTRHLVSCTKRFRMDKNLEPPLDWDTPGKLPKMPKNRLLHQSAFNTASSYVGNAQQQQHQQSQRSLLVQYPTMSSMGSKYIQQGNRMQLPPLLQAPKAKPIPGLIRTNPGMINPINKINQNLPRGEIFNFLNVSSPVHILTKVVLYLICMCTFLRNDNENCHWTTSSYTTTNCGRSSYSSGGLTDSYKKKSTLHSLVWQAGLLICSYLMTFTGHW